MATSSLFKQTHNLYGLIIYEFVEARRTAGLNNAPACLWSSSPPNELKEAPEQALSANAGFVSFVISPRHVEGKKLDKTVWSLSTFHAYVNYHVKALDRAKPDESANIAAHSKSFKRLSIDESRGNSHSKALVPHEK
ncbi:actin-related protein 2/3 complex subunit 2A [Tanacetum coccineum]